MKTILLAFLLLAGATQAHALTEHEGLVHDLAHFAAGDIVGLTAGLILEPERAKHPILVPVICFGLAVAAGAAKEAYDQESGGKFDLGQFGSTCAGGAVAGITIWRFR